MVRRLCSTLSSPRRFGSGRARTTVSVSRQYSSIPLCVHSAFRSLKHQNATLKHQKTGAAKGDFVEGHVKRVCGTISCAYVQLLWRTFRLSSPGGCSALLCCALCSLPGLPDCTQPRHGLKPSHISVTQPNCQMTVEPLEH